MANFSTHRTTSKFGTLPVFLTTISTILGAILFLRFGYAVGHQDFLGAIGITLYPSQAISVAFYVIAFSKAFEPLIRFLDYEINTPVIDKRWIGIFSMGILGVFILTRGADIPIGLAAASLSSALGSIMVAPRTFGDIDFVARIISMFFMVTYGVICLISLLEHFAADPSYRPTFRSRWYLSLSGSNQKERGLVNLFRGVVFQMSRHLQILAQHADREDLNVHWRPFTICISKDTFMRRSAFDVLRWISLKYGFGTYIHSIKGFLTEKTNTESKAVLTIIGFRHEQLRTEGYKTFTDYDNLGNILFVSANTKKEIK